MKKVNKKVERLKVKWKEEEKIKKLEELKKELMEEVCNQTHGPEM